MKAEKIGRARRPRALFLQATEPGAYPPLIHASTLMADAGWDVTFLSAPLEGNLLSLPAHPRIAVHAIRTRPSHVMRPSDYLAYCTAAARLALSLRPDAVYASDALGAGPGLLAAKLARAALVYHEHDSPTAGMLRPWLARLRRAAAQSARLVIFPNETRARIAQSDLGFDSKRLHIVWNVPRRHELPSLTPSEEPPLIAYYHGIISPDRVTPEVIEAVRRFRGRVRLRVAGYEAPSAIGYVQRLVELGRGHDGTPLVDYVGQVPRDRLLAETAHAHVGLALMPMVDDDINLSHMAGASNKAFDYMAGGLALLVSDLSEWREMFVKTGYGRPCDPADTNSIAAQFTWFLEQTAERRAMAARGRARIEGDWNYDTAFAPVLRELGASV